MEIYLRGSIEFQQPKAGWWKDPSVFAAVCEALRRAGLWLGLDYAGKSGARRLAKVRGAAHLAQWSTRWKDRTDYLISSDPSGDQRKTTLRVQPRTDCLLPYYVIAGEDAEAHRATVLDQIVAFAVDLRKRPLLGGVGLYAWNVTLDTDYPRPRPPRNAINWVSGAVLSVIDREQCARPSSPPDVRDYFERVLAAPLPPGATREDHGPLAVLRFVPDLTDDAAVARARGEQHRWILGLVPNDELGPFWNEAGDERVLLLAGTPHPPLTIYDAFHHHGYKAVFLTEDGGGEAELDEAAAWLAAGQLPDGTRVEGISIVAPTRAAALAALPRVARRGFSRLLYVDNNGTFWDPFPSGQWLPSA